MCRTFLLMKNFEFIKYNISIWLYISYTTTPPLDIRRTFRLTYWQDLWIQIVSRPLKGVTYYLDSNQHRVFLYRWETRRSSKRSTHNQVEDSIWSGGTEASPSSKSREDHWIHKVWLPVQGEGQSFWSCCSHGQHGFHHRLQQFQERSPSGSR